MALLESVDCSSPSAPTRWKKWLLAIKGVMAVGVFAFTLWAATNLLLQSRAEVSAAIITLLVMAGLLMAAGAVYRETAAWRRPIAALADQLSKRTTGDKTDITSLPARLRPLELPLNALLAELRAREADVRAQEIEKRALETEIRQRVLNRTDALERKLGALEAKANRDALTQCFNRRAMDEQLPRLIADCRQKQADLVLLMIDVDYFKKLNDTLGHAAGDELLRAIGQIIRSSLREGDAPYRYGGDEFAIVLPGGDPIAAAALADRLRHLVDGLTRQYRGLSPRPQLSTGIAALSDGPADAPALLAAADARLYDIKRARKVQRVA